MDDELTAEQKAELLKRLPVLQYFEYAHLPAHLAVVSAPFCGLAWQSARAYPSGPELAAGLRKLLEAKDCLVRVALAG
jgi:hypothetical protein